MINEKMCKFKDMILFYSLPLNLTMSPDEPPSLFNGHEKSRLYKPALELVELSGIEPLTS